nr:RNB domain-containing ribonuclease [Microbacterium invictum]
MADSLSALRAELGLPESFPPAVQAEADLAAQSVPVEPAASTLADLRHIEFLTIDPAGSTDLDQALHLERTATGAVLHYAIADVAAYVVPEGAMDAEARTRGQTMYAPDGRIPLHPAVLSEGAASLLPGHDRRAFVWRFVLDEGARPVETTLTRAVVRSRAQWSYVDAQAAVDAGTAPYSLTALPWFGAERAARESERGGASLNIPETRVVREPGGYRLERSDGVPLEDWNAHVSLLTGMAAAEIMLAGRIGILRTMPPAAAEDIEEFRTQTVALGLPWLERQPYGDYLRDLPRTPAARAVREHAGGLFRGAGYVTFDGEVPEQTVQSAIGAAYAHTTAPLRRLVDRWVLVICEALANGREVPAWARGSLAELPALMTRSSQRASQLNAGALDRVEAAVLHGREGEEFEGLVLARRGDGARVQLRRPPVEAKVKGLDDVAPGTIVRLRLVRTSIADGTASFTPVVS